MKKTSLLVTSLYGLLVFCVDLIIVFFSIFLAFMIKFSFNPPLFNYESFVITSPIIAFAYIVFMYVYGLSDVLKQSIGEVIYSTFLTVIALAVSTMAITFFMRAFSYPRSVIIISTILQFSILSLWRCLMWKVKRRQHGRKPTVVIGNSNADHIAKKILLKQRDIYDIKYICNCSCNNLWQYIENSEVVFLCEDVDAFTRNSIIDFCINDRKSLYIIPRIYDIALLNSKLNTVDDIPVLKVRKIGLNFEQRLVKRILDLIISLIGIIISSPIMILVALLIIVEDGGPVLYKQQRVTDGEKIFNVIKFRTMVKNAEKLTGPVLAGQDDPRITKVGRFIRATRLDELPQLFNILTGHMSVVGPRPERPFFVEQFKKQIPDYKYRTLVKAGLTGLAQVLGKYNTTAEDKARYDIIYIKNYSILFDIKLILQTIKIMFMKESTEGVKEDITLNSLLKYLNEEITIDQE